MTAAPGRGRLLLVPAPLDFGCMEQAPLEAVMPPDTLARAARLAHWICEDAKSARAYLKRIGAITPLAAPLQEMHISALPAAVRKGDRGDTFDATALLAPALEGHDVGLLSEAGMPAIADPGSSVVRSAHRLGIAVIALAGPVSLMLALAGSGLNGQSFAFAGYLPQSADERARRIRDLERLARDTGQTQLFIETPYRNSALLSALVATLQPDTMLCVSAGLSLPGAWVRSATVSQWKRLQASLDDRVPAVFALGR